MIIGGRVYKHGKFWISELPALDAMTQGMSRSEAIEMMKDWVRSILSREKLEVEVEIGPSGTIQVELDEALNNELLALILRRQRAKAGLTIRQIAKKLGSRSHNSYAQYEQGKVTPSLSQLEKILTTLDSETKIKIS